jgi:ATP-dependent DNA ligase
MQPTYSINDVANQDLATATRPSISLGPEQPQRIMAKSKKAPVPIGFIESMECLPVKQLPQGKEWSYEIKLDGFRLEAVKKNGETTVYSRRGNILNRKFHYIATALQKLPDNTVLDGELVALDDDGKSDFGLLQNFRSAESKVRRISASSPARCTLLMPEVLSTQ